MENCLYIIAYKIDHLHYAVDIETLIILNIYKITNSDQLKLYVKLQQTPPQSETVTVDFSRIKHEIILKNDEILTNLIWPIVVVTLNYVIAGLCSVARQIIKYSNNKKIRKLLGFRDACLMACNETSIWTRFCEIDMIKTTKSILKSNQIIDDSFDLPKDLARFEYHLSQPVRIHNIYKVAREYNNDKDITSEIPIENLKLSHTYSEGPFMTLSDVILLPCYRIFFELYDFNKFTTILPLSQAWYNTMLDKGLMQIKFKTNRACIRTFETIKIPDFIKQSLYTSDPNRYKPEKRIYTKQKDITNSLRIINRIDITNDLYPYGDEIDLNWSELPQQINPINNGGLPEKRAYRKCDQLSNLAKAVLKMTADRSCKIVDFCSGSGHLGILLAYLLPKCRIIFIENKELSLIRAKERIEQLKLTNCLMLQTNLDFFIGNFDIGVSLHACDVATDLVIQMCIKNKANFVCCPCCYGGIRDCYHLTYPRSLEYQQLNMQLKDYLILAHAADQTHEPNVSKTTQGFVCMDAIDTDRKLYAESCGYKVYLGKLQPFSCTNKNNLLVGLYDVGFCKNERVLNGTIQC